MKEILAVVIILTLGTFGLSQVFGSSLLDSLCTSPDYVELEEICTQYESSNASRQDLIRLGVLVDSFQARYVRTNFERSIELANIGYNTWTAVDSTERICSSLLQISRGYYFKDNLLRASDYAFEALVLAEKDALNQSEIDARWAIAWIYFRIGEHATSVQYMKSTRPEERPDSTFNWFRYYNALGVYYRSLDADSSFFYFQMGLNEAKTDVNKALIYSNMASYLREHGRCTESLEQMRWALQVNRRNENLEQLCGNLVVTGLLFNKLNQLDSSLAYLHEAKRMAIHLNDNRRLLHAYRNLARVYEKKGDVDNALSAYKSYHDLLSSLNYNSHLGSIIRDDLARRNELNQSIIESLEAEKNFQLRDLHRQRIITILSLTIGLLVIIGALLFTRNILNRRKREERLKTEVLNRELIESELKSLKAQMNPHFLFNTLNSIKLFIIKNEARLAADFLAKFARLMRLTLQHSDEKWIDLSEEIELLDIYMTMENLRLKQPFSWEMIIDDRVGLNTMKIPPMVLQPFVENAIWHGLSHRDEPGGKITIHFEQREEEMICKIRDNGVGREVSKKLGRKSLRKSMGLKLTNDRLQLLGSVYGHPCESRIHDLYHDGQPAGTEVEIVLPTYSAPLSNPSSRT